MGELDLSQRANNAAFVECEVTLYRVPGMALLLSGQINLAKSVMTTGVVTSQSMNRFFALCETLRRLEMRGDGRTFLVVF